MSLISTKEDLDRLDRDGKLEMNIELIDFIGDVGVYREVQKMIDDHAESELKVDEETILSADRDTKARVVEVAIPTVKVVFEKVD